MTEPMTIEMDSRVLREVDAAAARLDQTREAFLQEAVQAFLAAQREHVAAIEVGLAQLNRGECVSQEEVELLADKYRVPA